MGCGGRVPALGRRPIEQQQRQQHCAPRCPPCRLSSVRSIGRHGGKLRQSLYRCVTAHGCVAAAVLGCQIQFQVDAGKAKGRSGGGRALMCTRQASIAFSSALFSPESLQLASMEAREVAGGQKAAGDEGAAGRVLCSRIC